MLQKVSAKVITQEERSNPPLARELMTAARAGLNNSDTAGPGLRRVRCGRGWRYLDVKGKTLGNKHRERCQALVIPPAWSDVWISPDPKGHIQAAGQDAAGRRQYIYHPAWQVAMSGAKFQDMARFAERLPRLRAALRRRLRDPADDTEYALAVLVGLIDCAGLRIGHRRYRRQSGSVGATTLKSKHIRMGPDGLQLCFPGKSGQKHAILIEDEEIAAGLSDLRGSPGKDLFALGDDRISADDVNRFIAQIIGPGFTSKDFRTWGGSVAATRALRTGGQATVASVARAASEWLGNTPAIARSAYIHPAILDAAEQEVSPLKRGGPTRLRADERICYALIAGKD